MVVRASPIGRCTNKVVRGKMFVCGGGEKMHRRRKEIVSLRTVKVEELSSKVRPSPRRPWGAWYNPRWGAPCLTGPCTRAQELIE